MTARERVPQRANRRYDGQTTEAHFEAPNAKLKKKAMENLAQMYKRHGVRLGLYSYKNHVVTQGFAIT